MMRQSVNGYVTHYNWNIQRINLMMFHYICIKIFLGVRNGDISRLNLPCQHCIQGWTCCQDQWRDIHQ